jgi:hypothetical protein
LVNETENKTVTRFALHVRESIYGFVSKELLKVWKLDIIIKSAEMLGTGFPRTLLQHTHGCRSAKSWQLVTAVKLV